MGFSPFLLQVARRYAGLSIDALAKVCFVFPNRRSGFFFTEYLKKEMFRRGNKLMIPPLITTMTALTQQWCRLVEASRPELLMLLFRTYLDLTQRPETDMPPALEPDRFLFWCDMIINDFNDVDMAMAPASHLYRNLKDLKELQTMPLDDRQLETIKRFWDTTGAPWNMPGTDFDRMWIYQDKGEHKDGVTHFMRLWEILGPLYDSFTDKLQAAGLCYPGMAYRTAFQKLKEMSPDDNFLDKQTYVFIGFSFLSVTEKEIMSILQKNGYAEFYWDTTMPQIGLDNKFPMRLINHYKEMFPQPKDFENTVSTQTPNITLHAVPSDIGQVNVAAKILRESKELSRANATEYAVVLPETGLCIPLLGALSLPEGVDANISIGYPVKDTPVAALMNAVATMRNNVRISDNDYLFYRNNVIAVVTQPMLMQRLPAECKNIINTVNVRRKLFISASKLIEAAGELAFLFKPLDHKDVDSLLDSYIGLILKLADFCSPQNVENETSRTVEEPIEKNKLEVKPHSITNDFLQGYCIQVEQIRNLIKKYRLGPVMHTAGESVIATIEKIMRQMTLSFAGTPLRGIQIMGVLETRALDFSDIIITSMNEQSFPRKMQKASFIPQNLRSAYRLDNLSDEETVMAYHFYRLIGKARNVHLIYNNDVYGLKSGEMSRYAYQLRYLCNNTSIKEIDYNFITWSPEVPPLSVSKKDEKVMKQLEAFTTAASPDDRRYLSASSLKKYLDCELNFYLSVVCRYNDDNNDDIHIDDSIYGKIVHSIMEDVYSCLPKMAWQGKEYIRVTPDDIDGLIKDPLHRLETLAHQAILKNYYANDPEPPTKLDGEALIFSNMAIDSVKSILAAERRYMLENKLEFFLFIDAEVRKKMTLEFPGGKKVNFTYIIDRVDRMFPKDEPSFLRIVDYKTGKDQTKYSGVKDLTDYHTDKPGNYKAPHAITQLLLYSIAYSRDPENNVDANERIMPIIYSFRDAMTENKINDIKDSKKKASLLDYQTVKDEFIADMGEKINDLFNPEIPFRQAPDDRSCKYCIFKDICNR